MLEKMKLLIGIEWGNRDLDQLLEALLESAQARLKILLGGLEIPKELESVVVDVAVSRFNRIGSEGAKSHDVEGEKISFETDDFSCFKDVIRAYLDKVNGESGKGGLKFL